MIVTLAKDGTILWVAVSPAKARARRRKEGARKGPRASLLRNAKHYAVVATPNGFRLTPHAP